MGRPTPMPPEAGDPCDKCDGILWEAGKTPRFAYATFTGVETCPGATNDFINDTYVLEQDEYQPCQWYLSTRSYGITYYIGTVDSEVKVRETANPSKTYFVSTDKPKCGTTFLNDQVACAGYDIGKNGSCEISFPQPVGP